MGQRTPLPRPAGPKNSAFSMLLLAAFALRAVGADPLPGDPSPDPSGPVDGGTFTFLPALPVIGNVSLGDITPETKVRVQSAMPNSPLLPVWQAHHVTVRCHGKPPTKIHRSSRRSNGRCDRWTTAKGLAVAAG